MPTPTDPHDGEHPAPPPAYPKSAAQLTATDFTHCRIGIEHRPARSAYYWRLELFTGEAGHSFTKTTRARISEHTDPLPVAHDELAALGLEIDPSHERGPLSTYRVRPAAKGPAGRPRPAPGTREAPRPSAPGAEIRPPAHAGEVDTHTPVE
ncbi:hypothetical protein [Streptomyces sp. NBC_01244]|uniref:hypothetical protein n=1 Tax=Streptomyces sp. NBC_01244 TaxID=2903797 RepID=UPI002E164CB7|nr:hypothetical protein OG247_44105 [Streptomyces sp. NBC_01244]